MMGYISLIPRLQNRKALNKEGLIKLQRTGSAAENGTKHPTGDLHAGTAVKHTNSRTIPAL